ncbi:MAG: DUF1501 domain-containing protein [Planctomycetaceae bacterium]|nr:DUF1501 domain-containing protein [Planctomycetaceae bacterium]
MPLFDPAIAALIDEIYQRALDKKVIVTREFGRTPRINPQKRMQSGVVQPGPDHSPAAKSVLVSKAGIQTGQVVGSTTSKGEHPQHRQLGPNDLLATVYRFLGIGYRKTVPKNAGHPVPLIPHRKTIPELLENES